MFASRRHRRDLKRLLLVTADTSALASPADNDVIIAAVRIPFYVHVLHSLNCRGGSVMRQMVFMSLLWRHKGLSRSGQEMSAVMKLGMVVRTYDAEVQIEYEKAEDKFR
jgi:hypothetical protein